MYPSEIICKACNIPPADPKPPKNFSATACMLCGRGITQSKDAVAWKPGGSSFADWQYLQKDSRDFVICRYCAPLTTKSRLTALSKAVVSVKDGAFSLSKDENITWFLETPPKTPFVAMFSPQKQKRPIHLFWKATPTLDKHLIFVQHGNVSLRIRQNILKEALEKAAEAADMARAEGLRIAANHPFRQLSRKMDTSGHGMIREDILLLSQKHDKLRAILGFLSPLSAGEIWALSILSKSQPEKPVAEPIGLA